MTQLPENACQPDNIADWRNWLEKHHATEKGVWLVNFKKASGKQRFTLDDAIEEALCFGWIDSKPAKLDEERSMLWFASRKGGSGWSRVNKERIARVIADGRMTPAGQAKIDAAKADGSWTLLDAVDNLEIPDDLAKAFATYQEARKNFEAFPRSVKRSTLEWIALAKRAETREKRIEETARLAEDNIRANQLRK